MRLVLAIAFALALLPPAGAQECVPGASTSNEDMTVVEVPNPVCGTVCYVVVDHDMEGCFGAVWVYPEANGIAGLQRGDECHDDTCGGQVGADVILP